MPELNRQAIGTVFAALLELGKTADPSRILPGKQKPVTRVLFRSQVLAEPFVIYAEVEQTPRCYRYRLMRAYRDPYRKSDVLLEIPATAQTDRPDLAAMFTLMTTPGYVQQAQAISDFLCSRSIWLTHLARPMRDEKTGVLLHVNDLSGKSRLNWYEAQHVEEQLSAMRRPALLAAFELEEKRRWPRVQPQVRLEVLQRDNLFRVPFRRQRKQGVFSLSIPPGFFS